jgi:hypothetical protein
MLNKEIASKVGNKVKVTDVNNLEEIPLTGLTTS